MAVIDAVLKPEPLEPVCVLTRLHLRGVRALIRFLWSYHRVSRSIRGVPGLMHYGLTIEGPFTVHILSIWESKESMYHWIGTEEHVHAIQRTYGLADERWSARWRLEAVSPSARRWPAVPELERAFVHQVDPRHAWDMTGSGEA
ncbi:MAG: antibiotic biosynthesis monooxygenase [Haloechinothrix sp.]